MAKKIEEEGAQNPQAEKLKALQAAIAKIDKDFGKGSIMKLGDEHVENVDVIPTGSIGLNAALGVGGYPKGRIIEIYGPESSGKTTLAIHAIAEAQKAGGIAAFIDAEHAFDFSMQRSWVWMWRTSGFLSPIMVSRPCRLLTNSFRRQPLTSWSSTLWLPLLRRRRLRVTWVTLP